MSHHGSLDMRHVRLSSAVIIDHRVKFRQINSNLSFVIVQFETSLSVYYEEEFNRIKTIFRFPWRPHSSSYISIFKIGSKQIEMEMELDHCCTVGLNYTNVNVHLSICFINHGWRTVSTEKMNSGSQSKINILKNRRALNDEWRLNGPHSDCVTNKINIQNDFQSLVYCSEFSKWFSIEHFVWIKSNKNL